MADRTYRYNERISDEELKKRLTLMENPEGYKKEKIQFKIQEKRRNVKGPKKILGILGGIITFVVVYAPIVYAVELLIRAVPEAKLSSLFLAGIILSIAIAGRAYNLISGDNFDIISWITDLYT